MRFYGGGLVAGNAGIFNNSVIGANTNPLMDPRFKIQGGEPWNSTPLLPGKDTEKYENQQQFAVPRQLPSAGIDIGNVGGLIAQAQPKRTLKELIGNLEGGMSDIPGDVRFRQDTQLLPYDPGNYAQNSKQNPLRNNRWPAGMPQIWMQPGVTPYFGNRQGPGLYGEMGTGAI